MGKKVHLGTRAVQIRLKLAASLWVVNPGVVEATEPPTNLSRLPLLFEKAAFNVSGRHAQHAPWQRKAPHPMAHRLLHPFLKHQLPELEGDRCPASHLASHFDVSTWRCLVLQTIQACHRAQCSSS